MARRSKDPHLIQALGKIDEIRRDFVIGRIGYLEAKIGMEPIIDTINARLIEVGSSKETINFVGVISNEEHKKV